VFDIEAEFDRRNSILCDQYFEAMETEPCRFTRHENHMAAWWRLVRWKANATAAARGKSLH
jgi:hypothetical protein